MDSDYDYIVVGAGPAGLTSAWLLAKAGKKCLIIEKTPEIGGCHAVRRSHDGTFSEHGPRVYSSSYATTIRMLNDMGIKFEDVFTPYNFTMSSIGGKTVSSLKLIEILKLAWAYVSIGDNKTISMREYTHGFSKESIDYLDRLCRLTDGATLDNYSVHKFMQLVNQQFLHKIYQPRDPNDQLLFPLITEKLRELNVDILLNTEAIDIEQSPLTLVTNSRKIRCRRILFAVPPENLLPFKKLYPQPTFNKWVNQNRYLDYISVALEWDRAIPLKKDWGFPATMWGIVYIVLNEYFESYKNKKTLISVAVTKIDEPVGPNGITARNAPKDFLVAEIINQLGLPVPDKATIGSHPGDPTHHSFAYIQGTIDPSPLPYQTSIEGVYQTGTQNGYADYAFTSMESAVVNAHAVVHQLEPTTRKYKIKNGLTLNKLLLLIVLTFLLLAGAYIFVNLIIKTT